MKHQAMYNFENRPGISDIYTLSGSRGVHNGLTSATERTEDGYLAVGDGYTVTAAVEERGGVIMRTDTLKNTADTPLGIHRYACRFAFPGGAFDVYTQKSHGQHESLGAWQPLVTEVTATAGGMFTTTDAAPVLAVYDRISRRGVVFHLLPCHAWQMSASLRAGSYGSALFTVVEIALYDPAPCLSLAPGEELSFSPVVFYEFTDRESLNCERLHAFMQEKYPRRPLPVLYNTWLGFFDRISMEKLLPEVQEAAAIGCEYFTVDAGWFGEGELSWGSAIGAWQENRTSAFCGKMRELADAVRRAGMRFGLWLEPERALGKTAIVREHPEYFLDTPLGSSYFLDFSNPEACRYMTELTLSLIKRYGIELLKFDFNASLPHDPKGRAFLDYHRGYRAYLAAIRAAYPDLYLECCAGGGHRMDLANYTLFDGFWFTDNQSPYDGLTILSGTVRRLPPAAIERWGVMTEADGFLSYSAGDAIPRLLATDDSTWQGIVSTSAAYMCGFFSGGSPAFSCRLGGLKAETKEAFAAFIAAHRRDRAFWTGASCRILCDTDGVLCLQYEHAREIRLVFYTAKPGNPVITVYPVTEARDYTVDGLPRTHASLLAEGVTVTLKKQSSVTVCLSPETSPLAGSQGEQA